MMSVRNLFTGLAILLVALVCAALPQVNGSSSQTAAGDMIYVPVMVTDAKNVPVTNLKEEHFQLLEDNKEQKVAYFSGAGEPLTLGIVLGLSARGPVKAPSQQDRITLDITNAVDRLRKANGAASPASVDQMPLDSDGMFSVVSKSADLLGKQSSPRRALVIVSDGLIASGTQTNNVPMPKTLIEAAKVSPFPIHFLFVVSSLPAPTLTDNSTYTTAYYLEQIADYSGGETFVGQVDNNLVQVSSDLRDTLKNEYVLGFRSTNTAKDGKWRKLAVKVNPPAGAPKLKVTAKSRHFVPKAN